MKWTEGLVHVAMRSILREQEWTLIAGEYPGGSDHELYPLNVVDPIVARDRSPDPRRHSLGELVPDLVALRKPDLIIAEAKVRYDERDRMKLESLVGTFVERLWSVLDKFSDERGFSELTPVRKLTLRPTLVFLADTSAPKPSNGMSYLRIKSMNEGFFEGALAPGKRL